MQVCWDFSAALPSVTWRLRVSRDSPHVDSESVFRNPHRHHVGRVTGQWHLVVSLWHVPHDCLTSSTETISNSSASCHLESPLSGLLLSQVLTPMLEALEHPTGVQGSSANESLRLRHWRGRPQSHIFEHVCRAVRGNGTRGRFGSESKKLPTGPTLVIIRKAFLEIQRSALGGRAPQWHSFTIVKMVRHLGF